MNFKLIIFQVYFCILPSISIRSLMTCIGWRTYALWRYSRARSLIISISVKTGCPASWSFNLRSFIWFFNSLFSSDKLWIILFWESISSEKFPMTNCCCWTWLLAALRVVRFLIQNCNIYFYFPLILQFSRKSW